MIERGANSNYNKYLAKHNLNNKLKLYEGCNNLTYKERESRSVDICKSQITNNNYLKFFNESNKKDDLADSYLQGIWYIKTKIFN